MLSFDKLLQNLSLGVFSNLAIGSEGAGFIQEDSRAKIGLYTNEALTELYGQFILSEKSFDLLTFAEKGEYVINSTNSFIGSGLVYDPAVLDPNGPNIIDSEDKPFKDDVIKILSIDTPRGYKLPINDPENGCSAFSPHSELLRFNAPVEGEVLTVRYQANHAEIIVGKCGGYDDQTVDLPKVLHDALYSYIAYKVFTSMNTPENTAKAREHLQLYTQILAKVVNKDLVSESTVFTHDKFENGGWV